MTKIKKVLVNLYNNYYDFRIGIKEQKNWRKDRKLQMELGVPNIMSVDDTLDVILSTDKSICRYGDGEFKLMDGESIQFQQSNSLMSQRLIEVIKSDNPNVLVCIPTFLDRINIVKPKLHSKAEKTRYKQATRYMNNIIASKREKWYSYFDMNRLYGNSIVSRFYASAYDDEYSERVISKWKQVWNDKDLLIVEGNLTRMGVGNDLFDNAKSIKRILAPAKNAFGRYDDIADAVLQNYNSELVLIALGPTATVLAYDLAKNGIRALDIGHIDIEYEWYLRKDKTHQKIEGKFVSEAADGDAVDSNINDDEYNSQIVGVI